MYWLIFLRPDLALFLQRFQGRRHRRQKLHDDGGGDVGHDVEGEDRHPPQGAAGEHVEHVQDAALLLLEDLLQGKRIDAGQRNVGAQTVDDQGAQREPKPFLQVVGLGQRPEAEIGCKLFSGRCHSVFPFKRPVRSGYGPSDPPSLCRSSPASWASAGSAAGAFSAACNGDRTASLFNGFHRGLRGARHADLQFRRQFALGQQAHAVALAPDHPGLDQRRGVDRLFGSSLLVDGLLQPADIDLG